MYIYVEHIDDASNSIEVIENDLIHYKVTEKRTELDSEDFWKNVHDNFKILYPDRSFIIKYEDKYRMYLPDELSMNLQGDEIEKKFERFTFTHVT
jgi:hypothetical protein